MRVPNGYGTIKKLSGSRRRPYVFLITKNGKQIPVAYFPTYIEADIYRADYNKEHRMYSLPAHKETFEEMYHRWLPAHISYTSPSSSTIAGYKNAYLHLSPIYEMNMQDIRYRDLQPIIDNMRKAGLSYSSCKKVRSLISLVFSYAQKMEVVQQNYAPLLHLGKNKAVRPHKPFSRQLINRLWKHSDIPGVGSILILLYTGMRVGEMLSLKKSDVYLRHRYFDIKQSKTNSGIRIIPIHDRIYPLILSLLSAPGEFLISRADGSPMSYAQYTSLWNRVMHEVRGKHTTHDCRHTVATLLSNAGANEVARRRILGHASGDVTDRVYTHKGLRQLRQTIHLLK